MCMYSKVVGMTTPNEGTSMKHAVLACGIDTGPCRAYADD